MKKRYLFLILLSLVIFSSCNRTKHFITDKEYRKKVEVQFEKQKKLAAMRANQLFGIFDQDLNQEEREALMFLFAYMPLSDLADYDGKFYLENVKASLAAKDTFSWGKKIPEVIFRHFVLPIRVNNENMDSSRSVFFMELKERIRKLSMKDAVLEVNHWCHEKVIYRGTDGRTSAPLATVKTAFGRCGEESTFTVAALRSVAIPARQCYTPRWAHCDDNHAWVEVWVDGQWHFIGACEPEPDLDMAWFTEPAKRAMLVNTNVFGNYEGPEDALIRDERYTKINILSNYTSTKRVFVKVTDERTNPVDSARVEFQLYNYAEFYPLYATFTNPNGLASLLTGFGDLIVWSGKGEKYAYRKIPANNSDTVLIILGEKPGRALTEEFDLLPPTEQKVASTIGDSLKKKNSEKLSFEDRVRANYESTFIDSAKTFRLAKTLKINPDTLWLFLKKSCGNWRELIDFISGNPTEMKPWVFPLLSSLSEKDLRDSDPEMLSDNILNTSKLKPGKVTKEMFIEYVLCPRVDNEWLKPYKTVFLKKFDAAFIQKAVKDPNMLVDWINSNIMINNEANYARAPISPAGVMELRVSDSHSRDIFFVALCRSLGIPSRLEPGTRLPQFYLKDNWKEVSFEKSSVSLDKKGRVLLLSDPGNTCKPEYYTHFTLEKYKDGFFRSLDFENDPRLETFPCSLELSPGYYMLVSGKRVNGGIVLARLQSFNVETGKTKTVTITLRKSMVSHAVSEILDLKNLFLLMNLKNGWEKNILKGFILGWMEPGKEPTRHFVADLKLRKAEFEQWKGSIFLVFSSEKEKQDFLFRNKKELPDRTIYLVAGNAALKSFTENLKLDSVPALPLVSCVNPRGEIIYFSEGYQIGLGTELLNVIQSVFH